MELSTMQEMIQCLKKIIDNNSQISIPSFGEKSMLKLHGINYDFFFDLNRSGHRRPKCTFQLREFYNKSDVLFRFDVIGKAHPNPKGNYAYSDQCIECPHVHISTYKDFGIAVALPLNDPLVKINLGTQGTDDLINCLKQVFKKINVANYSSFHYNQERDLF